MFGGILIFFWGVILKDYLTGNPSHKEKAAPILFYVLPPFTILILWWVPSFKKVTLDKDTLIICGFRSEARIPVSQIEKIYERPYGRGMEHITIKFKSKTEFGWRVRILIGERGSAFKKVARLLRDAVSGKITSVKINHISQDALKTPNLHQKAVLVRGWADEELSKILTDFADIYEDELGKKFEFNVFPYEHGATRINFPNDIPAKEFSFLVNYLNYPKDYDLKGRTISVSGQATLSLGFHPPSKSFIGKKAVFYVPSNDEDYDVVYIRVGDETFVNSFASFKWKKVEDPRIPGGIDLQKC